jgi:uncharacterized protein (TIGR03435 family)
MSRHSFALFVPMLVSAIFSSGVALAQTAPGNPAFEVATVKPAAPLDLEKMAADMQAGKMPKVGPHVDATRAEYSYMSLKELIANAYSLKAYQISGPAWLSTQRFDIVANMPGGAAKEDAPKMLQKLLEERFKLSVHRDTQDYPELALLVGKDGPHMKESSAAAEPIDPNAPLKPGEMKMDAPGGQFRMTQNADGSSTINMGAKGKITQRIDPQAQTVHMDADTVTMAGFADMLTNLLKMGGGSAPQVVDKTDLKGNYQVSRDISLADLMTMAMATAQDMGISVPPTMANAGAANASTPATASDPSGGSSIYASVQKLGLKLEKRKVKAEELLIDHIEKTPTEN